MRITNNMILNTSSSNINDVKNSLDKTNTQMTNQQKINRPSEDPVIAVRSLRLQTTYAKTEQYYRKNIPDAAAWLDVTETALIGMKDVITEMRTLSVNGATDTLTQDDRNTILTQLKQLQNEIFSTANADYAGRTVFTGYRTDKTMTFMGNEKDTAYTIKEVIDTSDMIQTRFYSNEVKMPQNPGEVNALTEDQRTGDYNTQQTEFYRMRLAYNGINGAKGDPNATPPIPDWDPIDLTKFKITYPDLDTFGQKQYDTVDKLDKNGNPIPSYDEYGNVRLDENGDTIYETEEVLRTIDIPYGDIKVYENEQEWEESEGGIKTVGANDIVIVRGTGDIIFGNDLAYAMQSNKASVDITYSKTGFQDGELRPEYYFNSTNITDPLKPIDYVKEDRAYDINYTIAENQSLKVNVEAADVFDHKPYQDMSDMINAVTYAIEAHDKLAKISNMINDPNYKDGATQEKLAQWKDIIQKECDYADDNLSKFYTSMIEKCDKYLSDMNLSITRLGCTVDQLKMTESRMSEHEEAVLQLQSQNDNVDLSQVMIDYTAVYTAYQSSLTAAGRLYQQTLLNYI